MPASTRQSGRDPIILMYHRFGVPPLRTTVRGQYVMPRLLDAQLRSLFARGLRPARLADVVADPLAHQDTFAVTLDDGYAAVPEAAWPIFQTHHVPITLFMVTGEIGGTNAWDVALGDRTEALCSAAQLTELAQHGVEIGSHTMTHAHLTQCTDEALAREVADSKRRLEDLLGREAVSFSYPYGDVDARVRDVVANAGYRYATATSKGAVTPTTDPLLLPRVNMRWNTIGPVLSQALTRAYRTQTANPPALDV
jgi:peptidoglycan/xylan/chitin deacetylase (PgdA/CDA1 family)